MKTRDVGALALLLAGILLAGCGGAATTPGMSGTGSSTAALSYTGAYPYEKDAVRLRLKADPHLNLFDGTPHTLFLCVYDLRDPNGFNQLLDEPDGMGKLLECSRFDPAVANTRKIVVQPGGEIDRMLARSEGAKYVGLVAGYSTLKKEDCVRLYPVPIIEERIGWSIRKTAMPGKLLIDLYLGPDSLQAGRGR
jgi:type VI secretion system VasD/TssJ family lipoprotein